MRRTRFILALSAAATAVTVLLAVGQRASAHFCSTPVEINVGEQVMINIGVAAEDKPVRAVDIEIPIGFKLKEPVGYLGYEPTRAGKWVHFEGAEIQPFSCTYFGFSGEATRRGRLVARIVTTAVDGARTRYADLRPAALYPPMVIYARTTAADFAADRSAGFPRWATALIVLVAGGATVGIVLLVRRRVTMGA